jgi:hypothetical protein
MHFCWDKEAIWCLTPHNWPTQPMLQNVFLPGLAGIVEVQIVEIKNADSRAFRSNSPVYCHIGSMLHSS